MTPTYHVFVSYAREDLELVRPWVDELKSGGVTAFFDMESLLCGMNWQEEIAKAIHAARLVVVFISRSSLASDFVPKELSLSVEMKKTILPVLLEKIEVTGQFALCITGVQRVEAYDKSSKEVWSSLQQSLQHAGIQWKSPSRRLIDDVRQRSRDVVLDDSPGNVRINRDRDPIPAPAPAPIPIPEPEPEQSTETTKDRGWLRGWFMLMAVALGIFLFFWMDGLSWFERQNVPPPIPELVETLEEEAQNFAKAYYQTANQNPAAQLTYLAEPVDYLGHQGWTKEQVKADLEAYAKKWTSQQIEVLKTPVARVVEPGKTVECDVSLRCTSENAVVKNITSFTGRLRLKLFGGALKIVNVSEVPGTRKSEPLQFKPEVQKKLVQEFITKAVRSGSSDSGMTAETIAAMYVEKPDYFGRIANHEEIIKETQTLISRWEVRDYRVLEGPEVVPATLGTPDVEVKTGLDYRVSSPSRGGKINQGWVRSIYIVHFSADGTPLIQKHAEVERGQ